MPSEKIEKLFEQHFQKNISLIINNNNIKSGKFLLIKNNIIGNNYYFDLSIERKKKIDVVKLPYPFGIEEHSNENLLYFDYRVSTLIHNRKDLQFKFSQYFNENTTFKPNKMFDTILEIQFS